MFVNQRAFGDFKDNVTSLAPGEASTHNSKELKSHSLNSFDSSTNVCHSKKTDFGLKNVDEKKVLKDKENLQPLKPKVKVPGIKVESCSDDPWSDTEDMLLCGDSEDDYGDVLPPECERIQKKEIDCLFFNYRSPEFNEETVDGLPSVLKDDQNMYNPDEDILPECERIQEEDIDCLLNYPSPEFIEETLDRLSSLLKDDQNMYNPDVYIPEFSPLIENPDISLLLYADTEFVPLPNI